MNKQSGADLLTDVLHHSDYNQCTNASDTCETRAAASALAELLHGPASPDSFEIWHQKWYNPRGRRKSVAKKKWRWGHK